MHHPPTPFGQCPKEKFSFGCLPYNISPDFTVGLPAINFFLAVPQQSFCATNHFDFSITSTENIILETVSTWRKAIAMQSICSLRNRNHSWSGSALVGKLVSLDASQILCWIEAEHSGQKPRGVAMKAPWLGLLLAAHAGRKWGHALPKPWFPNSPILLNRAPRPLAPLWLVLLLWCWQGSWRSWCWCTNPTPSTVIIHAAFSKAWMAYCADDCFGRFVYERTKLD